MKKCKRNVDSRYPLGMKHRRQFALNVINIITHDWQLNTLAKWHLQIQSHMFDPHICFSSLPLFWKIKSQLFSQTEKKAKKACLDSWAFTFTVWWTIMATSRSEEVPETLLRDGICSSQGSDSITSKARNAGSSVQEAFPWLLFCN